MIRALVLLLLPALAQAETLRIATYNTELSRKGPGLLLRDIQRGDAQVQAVVEVLGAAHPDIVALQGIDWDLDGLALAALTDQLRASGLDYPYVFSAQPNSGKATQIDMDGDGQTQGPGDAQGWGRFTGQGGMAVLSRYPILNTQVQDHSDLLWRDLPGAELPVSDGAPYPSHEAQQIQHLSSTAHWVVPIETPLGRLNVMTFHATPPVFDGPEDRNGLRNRDEIRLWSLVMNGELGPAPTPPFVIAGDANLDPIHGEGCKEAIRALLSDPHLQDPRPRDHAGSLTTVSWKAVGEMRVDYLIPSSDLHVADAGVFWPQERAPLGGSARQASRHRLIWADLTARP